MTTSLRSLLTVAAASLTILAGSVVWTGCDTAGALDSLTISPSAATLAAGQSQQFDVSGGYHYNWSLVASSSSTGTTVSGSGSLSRTTGSSVIYTAPSNVSGLSSVTLHVVSTIQGSGTATTNTSAYSVAADAIITFH